jgi:hypothetical protein
MKWLLIAAISLFSFQNPKVYICQSAASYAYHRGFCQGLRNCTHRIDTVTISEAFALGYKKACGYCYR